MLQSVLRIVFTGTCAVFKYNSDQNYTFDSFIRLNSKKSSVCVGVSVVVGLFVVNNLLMFS